jgi:hypothetical protein
LILRVSPTQWVPRSFTKQRGIDEIHLFLGYLEPGKYENMAESERNTMLYECFSYNDEPRKNRDRLNKAKIWQREA